MCVCGQLMQCKDIAAVKVTEMTKLIQTALDHDTAARSMGKANSLTSTDDTAAVALSGSMHVSDTQAVDMEAARQTAVTVLSAATDDDVSSVSHPDSVPVSAILDSGTILTFSVLSICDFHIGSHHVACICSRV